MNNPATHAPLENAAVEETLEEYYNRGIQALESEPGKSDKTRFILKIVNNTRFDLDSSDSSLGFRPSDLARLNLGPGQMCAFHQDFRYIRELGSRSKDIFHEYIQFGDESFGARIKFGLRINIGFGVFVPSVTPVRTCKVISTGSTRMRCSAKITRALTSEPFSFTMEVTFGPTKA